MKLDHRLYNIDKSPRLYNYLLRKMQSYPFDWNWDSFTVTNTAATTLIVILFSASCTRSFLLRILCAPRSFLYSLGRRREKGDVSSSREEEEEENEVVEEEDGEHVWQDEGGNRMFLRRWRYMMEERLPYIPEFLSLTFGRIQKISGRLMLDVEGEDDAFQTSHKKNKGNNNFYNNKNVGRLGQMAGISEGGNVVSRGQLPNIALPPPPAISKGIGGKNEMTEYDVYYHSESKKSKVVSFDPNIEPAFLNDNDYPDDWMVYDPIQGKIVSRKELKVEPRLKPQAIHAQ